MSDLNSWNGREMDSLHVIPLHVMSCKFHDLRLPHRQNWSTVGICRYAPSEVTYTSANKISCEIKWSLGVVHVPPQKTWSITIIYKKIPQHKNHSPNNQRRWFFPQREDWYTKLDTRWDQKSSSTEIQPQEGTLVLILSVCHLALTPNW